MAAPGANSAVSYYVLLWLRCLGKAVDEERRMVVRSHRVGDGDGGGSSTVRAAERR